MSNFQLFPPSQLILSPRLSSDEPELAPLNGIDTTPLPDGALCYVTEEQILYRLDKQSTDAADGSTVVAPLVGPGRWIGIDARLGIGAWSHVRNINSGWSITDGGPVQTLATFNFTLPRAMYLEAHITLSGNATVGSLRSALTIDDGGTYFSSATGFADWPGPPGPNAAAQKASQLVYHVRSLVEVAAGTYAWPIKLAPSTADAGATVIGNQITAASLREAFSIE